jgi:hypothetical protein
MPHHPGLAASPTPRPILKMEAMPRVFAPDGTRPQNHRASFVTSRILSARQQHLYWQAGTATLTDRSARPVRAGTMLAIDGSCVCASAFHRLRISSLSRPAAVWPPRAPPPDRPDKGPPFSAVNHSCCESQRYGAEPWKQGVVTDLVSHRRIQRSTRDVLPSMNTDPTGLDDH